MSDLGAKTACIKRPPVYMDHLSHCLGWSLEKLDCTAEPVLNAEKLYSRTHVLKAAFIARHRAYIELFILDEPRSSPSAGRRSPHCHNITAISPGVSCNMDTVLID